MYKIESKCTVEETEDYSRIKILEATFRGLKIDYTINFSDGSVLECKFKKCDVCGSTNVLEYPHIGINCEDCNPDPKL